MLQPLGELGFACAYGQAVELGLPLLASMPCASAGGVVVGWIITAGAGIEREGESTKGEVFFHFQAAFGGQGGAYRGSLKAGLGVSGCLNVKYGAWR